MDKDEKYRVDSWVEHALYSQLKSVMTQGHITEADTAVLTPLTHMYQAIQVKNVYEELQSLWHLLVDGEGSIYIKTTYEGIEVTIDKDVDVNITGDARGKPQPPKSPQSPKPSPRKG